MRSGTCFALLLLACSESSSGTSSGSGGVSGSGALPSGGTAGAQLTGGTAGTTASGGTAGLADASDAKLPGDCSGGGPPAMVQLTGPDGTPYCMDATEVTQAHYAEFLAALPGSPGIEDPRCADLNDGHQPYVNNYPCSDGGAPGCTHECNPTTFAPSTTPNRPIVCIDVCDAFAYCKWAGKRLCGKIGGGALPLDDDASNPSSQWYAACSQNGTRVYPYGDAYAPATCEGIDVTLATDAGFAGKKDVGALPCHGTGPWAAIFDLSGGVAEFEDACSEFGTKDWGCRTRGGSLWSPAADLACASEAGKAWYQRDASTGFRCCRD